VNGRDLSVGLFATGVRAGFAAGRVASIPVRVLARTPGVRPIVLELGERISEEGADTRARVRDRAEAATSTLTTPELERIIESALDGPLADAVARRLVDRVLASPELDRVVEHVASSPAVRAAVAQQGRSLADEVAASVRTRSSALDGRLEALVGRRPPEGQAAARGYAGLATRAVAFVVDLVLAGVAFLAAGALAALALTLIGRPDEWVGAALLGTLWVIVAGTYFVVCWSTVGQTPGLRVVGKRVARGDGPPGVGRAVVRFVVLVLGLLPFLVSAVLVLLDGRRRALHDLVAGTVVVAAGPAR